MKIYSFFFTFWMLLVSLTSSVVSAEEIRLRLGAGMGVGVLVAGDKYATGGLSLSPSVVVGMKFHPWIGISYQNLPNLNTFRKITYLGILDQNSLMVTLIPLDYLYLDLGPSFDIFSMILCSNQAFCARQTGLAGGGHFRAAILWKIMSYGMGAVLNFHITVMPSVLYDGMVVTSNIGPVWEWR